MGLMDRIKSLATLPSRLHGAVLKGFNSGTDLPAGFPAYLGGGGPGGFVSDHWAESKQVIGASFTAIRAVARTCAKSAIHVHATGDRARKHLDRAMRMATKGLIPNEVVVALKASVVGSESGEDSVPLGHDNPLLRKLLHPNPWMSKAQFLYQHAQQASATGTTLIWTRRNNFVKYDKRGVPVQLFIIPTGVTFPIPPDQNKFPSGAYRVMPVGAYGGVKNGGNDFSDPFGEYAWSNLMLTGGLVDGREINPVRWPHPIFLTDGLSPMEAGKTWIDSANQLDQATMAGFRNTLKPGYIFQMATGEEEPSKEESDRFDMWIASKNAGIGNVGKHLRLPKGIEIADSDRSVHELDYVNGRQAMMQDVQSLWAVPPIASGYQQAGAYAAYFAALLQFTEQAVDPVMQLLADDLEMDLVPAFGGDMEIKIIAPPINDRQQREAEYASRAATGSITHSEYRKALNLPQWPARIGDLPTNTPIGALLAKELGIDLSALDVSANNVQNQGQTQNITKPTPEKTTDTNPKGTNPGANGKPQTRMGPASEIGGAVRTRSTSRTRKKTLEFMPLMLRGDARLNGYATGDY